MGEVTIFEWIGKCSLLELKKVTYTVEMFFFFLTKCLNMGIKVNAFVVQKLEAALK